MAKILLADDSGHAQRMGAKILSAEGHEVATVSNGQAAIKMLPDFHPDLIVADVFMPGKTGYEVCQFIKSDSNYNWIPVLLIVGKMEPYDPVEGQRVHADGVVTKPLESSDLVATVQNLLAALKKPAPPAPPPARPKKPAAAPAPEPSPEASSADLLATPMTTPVEFEIPEALRDQPVSMIGELPEPQVAPPAAMEIAAVEIEGSSPEVTPLEAGPVEAPSPSDTDTVPLENFLPLIEAAGAGLQEPSAPVLETSGRETFADAASFLPAIPIQESAPAPQSSWMAEAVAVTEEDKKLFEPPPPDWQGLVSLVQAEDEDERIPAIAAAGVGRMEPQPEPESAKAAAAASGAPAEAEAPTAQTLLRPGGSRDDEPAQRTVSSSPAIAAAALPTDSVELPAPTIAPLDHATVEQIVRETVEEMMPQIVDRIAQATGISFAKKG